MSIDSRLERLETAAQERRERAIGKMIDALTAAQRAAFEEPLGRDLAGEDLSPDLAQEAAGCVDTMLGALTASERRAFEAAL